MKNPLKETLSQLSNDPKVIEAGIIGTERTLIIDMIEAIKEFLKSGSILTSLEVCEFIIEQIRNGNHEENFDAKLRARMFLENLYY